MEAAYATQTTPDHVVTLNYDGDRLSPDPEILPVKVGDTIAFRQGVAPEGHTLGISFDNPEYFSAATYAEGDEPIAVLKAVTRENGTYRCGLTPYGGVVDPSTMKAGGAVEVETGSGGGR